MAWTSPRTWVDSEVATAALMNAHIRDNLIVLETPRDATGRISALDSTTVANLSGTNLTGVAKPAGSNTFSAGTHNLGAGTPSRMVVPVGADKYDGSPGSKGTGSVWVEGDYLHHVDTQNREWRFLGDYVSTPAGAVAGSWWVEGSDVHYIDADGDERKVVMQGTVADTPAHTDSAALGASAWVENRYFHWIRESGAVEQIGHKDVAHGDGVPHDDHSDHSDVSHEDVAHEDVSHDDVAHTDVAHTDTSSHDDHSDNVSHTDINSEPPHEDHNDHQDHADHSDVAHSDVAHGDAAHEDVTHTDIPHTDSTIHTDLTSHTDTAHIDGPPELIGP